MTIIEFRNVMNEYMASKEPFVFIIDFELNRPRLWKLSEIRDEELLFDFSNAPRNPHSALTKAFELLVDPITLEIYETKYDLVRQHLDYGDTFLTNLTVKTKVDLNLSLRELYDICRAKYKFYLKDTFLCFSPEIFVRIKDGVISSYPMKGTIDATIPDAEAKILSNQKEMAEHVTIVDLIRNDLSMIASDVRVTKFRYVDKIVAHGKSLLQVSSEVSGNLLNSFNLDPAGAFLSLLPAGSISGAPKAKTLNIIRAAEGDERGYYTGVCGYFDGQTLDSGVMIRFIEQQGDSLYYRSGGGITTQSDLHSEYQEVLDKIYVPID